MEQVNQEAVSNESNVAGTVKQRAPIINGRMPVAVVSLVRFGNNKDKSTKELATLFGTTVGKIDDIRKGRNFAYVTADYKPTQADKDQAIAWLKSHPSYDASGVDSVVVELEGIPLASDEEAAAFAAKRTAARGQSPVTKDGEVADAGGGNRRPKREKKAKGDAAPADSGATGDALLA